MDLCALPVVPGTTAPLRLVDMIESVHAYAGCGTRILSCLWRKMQISKTWYAAESEGSEWPEGGPLTTSLVAVT